MNKMKIKGWCVLGAVIVAMAGCSGVKIRPITREDPYVEGLRFYRPHPYLWVTQDRDGGLKGTIIWLPDKSQEYVATVTSGLGRVDAKFTLENGWNLTSLNEARESETAEIINALSGSLREASKVLMGTKEETLRPGLYVFDFDGTGRVSGIRPVIRFE